MSVAVSKKHRVSLRTVLTVWLVLVCLMILAMVIIGGITRLAGSGLSIVSWEPVTGILPPLNDQQWEEAFHAYQAYPQYQIMNTQMTMEQFQEIYFWEYFHRLFARLVGLVYGIPYLLILGLRMVPREFARKLTIGLILGGSQGVLGWCMVKSGLVDQPYVSHYRLAAHLLLALIVVGYLFHSILSLYGSASASHSPQAVSRSVVLRILGRILLALVMLQILYGAFTAGLRAGWMYNTFPLMGSHFIAPEALALSPAVRNFFENPMMVQFVHRTLGWIFAGLVLCTWIYSRVAEFDRRQKRGVTILAAWTLLQFSSGIITLLLRVPIGMGVLHQAGAAVVFLAILYLLHLVKLRPAKQLLHASSSVHPPVGDHALAANH